MLFPTKIEQISPQIDGNSMGNSPVTNLYATVGSLYDVCPRGGAMGLRCKKSFVQGAFIASTVLLLALAAVRWVIATRRVCMTAAARPDDCFQGDCAAVVSAYDADDDGVDDQSDILSSALAYVSTRPAYKSAYYTSGYPDDEFGVCTDVVAFALRDSGYDLQALVARDVALRPDAYGIDVPDSAIDFRRTGNLQVFFDAHAHALTLDTANIEEWQGGDIVVFSGHIGIVSDRRRSDGIPHLIHHSSSFQLAYEEDALQRCGEIIGHYRIDGSMLVSLQ